MQWKQQHRPAQQHRRQRHACNGYMYRQHIGHGLAQVVEYLTPQTHPTHNRGKVVVQQHQGSRLPGHIRAAPSHGHAHMGGLECRRVVDTVARHGHHSPAPLQGLHNSKLLCRCNARAHLHVLHALLQGGLVEPVELIAGEHLMGRRHQSGARRNGTGGGRVVASDHHHPDASFATLGHGWHHPGTQRIHQAQQAEEAKLEVLGLRPPGTRETGAGHRQYPQALRGHGLHSQRNRLVLRRRQPAQGQDGLG